MIDTSDFKKGVCILYKNEPCIIVDFSVSTPTARGANSIFKTKLRNLETGQLYHDSIRSGEKFSEVDLEHHAASYLYSAASRWHFLDDVSYEQFDFGKDELGGDELFLVEDISGLEAMLIDGHIVSLQLPPHVVLEVSECDPCIKGAMGSGLLKPARCTTGLSVQVPAYVEIGTRIKVDTRDGQFVAREK